MEFHEIDMIGTFKAEELATLPAWQASDERRFVYAADVDKYYYGTGSRWINYIPNSSYTANSILAATVSESPSAVSIAEQRVLGRKTGGEIDDLTATEVLDMISTTNNNVVLREAGTWAGKTITQILDKISSTSGHILVRGSSAWGGEPLFPSGTKMVFYQASAPTGWTQETTNTDAALRVVSTAGGGTGGTHGLSSPPSTAHVHTGPNHTHTGVDHTHTGPSHTHTTGDLTLTAAQSGLPSHSHSYYTDRPGGSVDTPRIITDYITALSTNSVNIIACSAANASSAHNHGNTGAAGTGATGGADRSLTTGAAGTGTTGSTSHTAFAPKYVDVIICVKN